MNEEYHTIGILYKTFKEAGFPHSESWFRRQEEKGNLQLPRSTTNFKKAQGARKLGAVRLLTQSMANSILEAFKPGGKGSWRYDEHDPNQGDRGSIMDQYPEEFNK